MSVNVTERERAKEREKERTQRKKATLVEFDGK